MLGEIAVAASRAGYRELVSWLAGLDGQAMVGIEGDALLAAKRVLAGDGRLDTAGGREPRRVLCLAGRVSLVR